jgi:hypothetical protein
MRWRSAPPIGTYFVFIVWFVGAIFLIETYPAIRVVRGSYVSALSA